MMSSKKLTTLFELLLEVVFKNSFPMRDVLSLEEELVKMFFLMCLV